MQHKVFNFFCKDMSKWEDLIHKKNSDLSIDDFCHKFIRGRDVWIVQTFYNLKKRGLPVQISSELSEDKINIIHYDDVVNLKKFHDRFVVSIRADRDPIFNTNIEIVQNNSSILSKNQYYIPHWPQPGILKRDFVRGCMLENIVYMGNKENIDEFYTSDKFLSALRSIGMRLVIQERDWWDYHDADVVLAVRTGSPFFLSSKPASKLVNAWIAGCPAILSRESGYRELRTSEDDYIEAMCPDDVLAALMQLRDKPELALKMRENGQKRAAAFSVEAITDRWERFLLGHAAKEYDIWRHVSPSLRKRRYLRGLLSRKIWGHWADGKQCHWAAEVLGEFRRRLAISVFNI